MNDRIHHTTGIIGSIAAWAGVMEFMQFALASTVSILAIIITGPKAWDKVSSWIEQIRKWRDDRKEKR